MDSNTYKYKQVVERLAYSQIYKWDIDLLACFLKWIKRQNADEFYLTIQIKDELIGNVEIHSYVKILRQLLNNKKLFWELCSRRAEHDTQWGSIAYTMHCFVSQDSGKNMNVAEMNKINLGSLQLKQGYSLLIIPF